MPSRERKEAYCAKMTDMLEKYKRVVIVGADFVSSKQMSQVRRALRPINSEVLMGKNTLMRRVLNTYCKENPDSVWTNILPFVQGNIGFIFTNDEVGKVAKIVHENVVPAAAKVGVVAECDVIVPPGPTGCDPGQTSWFQALNCPTKISKGQIEIVSEIKLVTKGERVGASEAGLLAKLNINPFSYGLKLETIFDDGEVYDAAVLEIEEADLVAKFSHNLRRFAALSVEAGLPNNVSLPHTVGRAVRRMLAITAEVEGYSLGEAFEEWDAIFNMDPEALAAMQAAAAASSGPAAGGDAPAEKEEEKAEPAAVDMGGGDLFGDDDGY